MNATMLRQNLYKTLDEVIETGKTIRVERKGKTILIVPEEKLQKKFKFKKRKLSLVPDNALIHNDWLKDWRNEHGISDDEFFTLRKR